MSEGPATWSAMACVWWCLHQLHYVHSDCPRGFNFTFWFDREPTQQVSKLLNFSYGPPHSIPKIGARTRRWGSHSASQQKLPWNPVLKTVPWQQGRDDALDRPGGLEGLALQDLQDLLPSCARDITRLDFSCGWQGCQFAEFFHLFYCAFHPGTRNWDMFAMW